MGGLRNVVVDAVKSGVKDAAKDAAKDAGRDAAKEAAAKAAKEAGKAAGEAAAKDVVKDAGESAVKNTGKVAAEIVEGGVKTPGFFKTLTHRMAEEHPALTAAGMLAAPFAVPAYLSIGWNHFFEGKSTLEAVSDEVIHEGLYRNVVDGAGDVLDFAGDTAKRAVNGTGDVLAYAGGMVKGGVDGTREMANTIQERLSAMVDQHYAVTDEQRELARQAQAQQAMLYKAAMEQGYFPQGYPQGAQYGGQQGGSMLGGIGSTFMNLLNGFTGGGNNNIALVGLLAGAYMLFGGLGGGLISKVIGGAMGGYAFRSLARGAGQQQQMTPVLTPSQVQDRMQQNYERQMQLAVLKEDDGVSNRTTLLRT